MSDTYFDLPSRLEDSFPEIDSDIVTDLRKTSEEYADIRMRWLTSKKSKRSDFNGSEQSGPFLHIISEKLTHKLIDYSLFVGYNIDG